MGPFRPSRIAPQARGKLAKTSKQQEILAHVNRGAANYFVGQEDIGREPDFSFWASITTVGPNGDKDYTDARYWVKPLYLGAGAVNDQVTTAPQSGTGGNNAPAAAYAPDAALLGVPAVTATNMAEVAYGSNQVGDNSHLLLPGQVVRVWAWGDVGGPVDAQHPQGTPPNVHYTFDKTPPFVLPVFLVVDGGTDPNWTYAMTYRDVTLNTHQSPTLGPPRITTSVVQANFGYAHIDPAGSNKYVLGYCNESPVTTTCS